MSEPPETSRRGLPPEEAPAVSGASPEPAAWRRREPASERRRVARLAHLTDVHMQPERSAAEGFAACLHHAQGLDDPPEFIVFGGDNLTDADAQDEAGAQEELDLWRSVIRAECSLPHYSVIGNHDVLGLDPHKGKRWAIEAFEMPGRHYTFDRAGWRFVVLESTWISEGQYKARLDDEQFEWFEDALRRTPTTTPVCVISHIPILSACAFLDGENEKSGDWFVPGAWLHIDARRIKSLFTRHRNVRLCLAGHHHMVDTVSYLGVRYACNGAVSGGWWGGAYQEFPPGYGVVDLFDDGSSEVRHVAYGWGTAPQRPHE